MKGSFGKLRLSCRGTWFGARCTTTEAFTDTRRSLRGKRRLRALCVSLDDCRGRSPGDGVLVVTRFDERPSAVPGVSHQTLRLEPGTEVSRSTFTQTHYRLLARSVRFWSQHVHHAICMRLSLAYSCRVAARFAGWRYSFVSRNCEGWGRLSDRERQDCPARCESSRQARSAPPIFNRRGHSRDT